MTTYLDAAHGLEIFDVDGVLIDDAPWPGGGAPGADGKTVLNGTVNPGAGVGVNGDFYINTNTWTIFGPKAAGVWPAGTSMIGPTGATGDDGATGATGPAGMVQIYDSQSDLSVTNTTSIGDLVRFALPTNLVAGDTVTVEAYGTLLNNTGAAETPTVTAGLGSSSFAGALGTSLGAQTTLRSWKFKMIIACESTSAQRIYAEFFVSASANTNVWTQIANVNLYMAKTFTSTEDTTSAKDVFFRITFTAASTNLTATTKAVSAIRQANV